MRVQLVLFLLAAVAICVADTGTSDSCYFGDGRPDLSWESESVLLESCGIEGTSASSLIQARDALIPVRVDSLPLSVIPPAVDDWVLTLMVEGSQDGLTSSDQVDMVLPPPGDMAIFVAFRGQADPSLSEPVPAVYDALYDSYHAPINVDLVRQSLSVVLTIKVL
ncbi:hypothetical protein KIPB_002863 [Kipferlia bialata]|uniref:Uncharacterized protein n=1 Tax=Kipferlia bialata TaxID=797122 RepID=A0A391NJN2_9EUKA|nr:hypothetical protein KIPB_002863 [Kipferlia bialata]|eukprot:g2863.t1